jgi:putative chitinase
MPVQRRAAPVMRPSIDMAVFFKEIRKSVFGGRLSKGQVDGLEKIIAYRADTWPRMIDEELAYILATAYHETAHTMQPIKEMGGQRYLRSKPYYPWYGRGLVQITWEANYRKYGITDPDKALEWPTALHVMFDGSIKGLYTGKKLSDYISARSQDYIGARRIINGTDRARMIAGYAVAFLSALKSANRTVRLPASVPSTIPNVRKQEFKPMMPAIFSKVLNMVVGNPLTGVPGALLVSTQLGGVLKALGEALVGIGAGAGIIDALGGFMSDPTVAAFIGGLGLVASKDWNVTGGDKRQ